MVLRGRREPPAACSRLSALAGSFHSKTHRKPPMLALQRPPPPPAVSNWAPAAELRCDQMKLPHSGIKPGGDGQMRFKRRGEIEQLKVKKKKKNLREWARFTWQAGGRSSAASVGSVSAFGCALAQIVLPASWCSTRSSRSTMGGQITLTQLVRICDLRL